MPKNLIINIISTVPLKDEAEIMNEFFKLLCTSITKVIEDKSTVYSVILQHTKKQPVITVLKNGVEFPIQIHSSDLGNKEVLAKIFSTILSSEKNNSYQNTVLYCWGHAMGFSLFSEITIDDKSFESLFLLLFGFELSSIFRINILNTIEKTDNNKIDLNAIFNTFGKTQFDKQQALTALTINELSESIRQNKLKFDLIVFDNCYMQTVDTAFAMQEHTKYIIATQTSIHWRGYAYDVFMGLNNKIDDSFCDKFILESFNVLKKLAEELNNESIAEVSISCFNAESANNLAFFNLCKQIITDMYNYLVDDDNKTSIQMADSIQNALKSCKDVTLKPDGKTGQRLELFDMLILFEKIIINFNKNDLKNKLTDLKKIYPTLISTTQASPYYKDITNGLSICFPLDFEKSEDNPYYYYFIDEDAQVKSQFAEESNWDQLISVYYRDFE